MRDAKTKPSEDDKAPEGRLKPLKSLAPISTPSTQDWTLPDVFRYDDDGDRRPPDTDRPDERDLDTDKLIEQIKRIQDFENLDEKQKLLVEKFTRPLIDALGTPELPETPPALWAERKAGGKVTPVDFIKLHYAPWLGKGLTRADIKRFDPALYNAYSAWIRPDRHPKDALELDKSPPHNRIENAEEAIERYREAARDRMSKKRPRNVNLVRKHN